MNILKIVMILLSMMPLNHYVRLDKFNDSSIDILIYCFTSTNDWEEYLIIKEKLSLEDKK